MYIGNKKLFYLQEGNEGDSSLVNHNFIKAALKQQQNLVTLLLDQLLKQEEDQDKDDTIYNMAMAAGTCLELVANVVEDDVIPLVMPFVQVNSWTISVMTKVFEGKCCQTCYKKLKAAIHILFRNLIILITWCALKISLRWSYPIIHQEYV